MRCKRVLLTGIMIVLFLSAIKNPYVFCQDGERVFSKEQIFSLAVTGMDVPVIFASSLDAIYRSVDQGETWEEVFILSVPDKNINRVYCDPFNVNVVFTATQDGLYESDDLGKSWHKIFRAGSDLANDCLSLVKTDKRFYLGTKEGLFVSYDQGRKWQKAFDQFSESFISHLVKDFYSVETIYLVCEKGVFKISEGQAPKRIYVSFGDEVPSEDYNDYDGDISDKLLSVRGLAISPEKEIYLSTFQGIYFSDNEGEGWQRIPSTGLLSLEAVDLLLTKDNRIFLATRKGAFELRDGYWRKIHDAIGSEYFNDIECVKDNEIWLAGRGGVYRVRVNEKEQSGVSLVSEEAVISRQGIDELFDNEPDIRDVQREAIEYAEANMNKIKEWRAQARLKAFFPTVSVGYNKTIYGSSNGAMAIGPRDWDLSLSWDVADLVWSADQTSIDSRSRLTVQLRQDILDQVTRLFYERRRLKIELCFFPCQTEREKISKELELEELTAALDALTDGLFFHFSE